MRGDCRRGPSRIGWRSAFHGSTGEAKAIAASQMAAARRTSAGSTDCSRSSATTTQRKSSSLASLIRAWRRAASSSESSGRRIQSGSSGMENSASTAATDWPMPLGSALKWSKENRRRSPTSKSRSALSRISLVRRASTAFFSDHAVQRSEPPVILGEPRRRIELADGKLELALLDRAPTLVDPAPDLGLEEKGIEPVLDQTVRAGPQHQEQEHGQGQPPAVPAKPADHPAGHRLAREPERCVVGDRLKIRRQLRRRCVPVGGFRRQAPADDRLECRRHVRMAAPQARRSGTPNLRRSKQCRAHRD